MLRYLLLTLAIMPVLSAQSQQKANVGYNKILESTSRSYFLKTTLYEHKITVYSSIQIDVDQSYKNNELNKKIEEDMKKQWQETIQEAYPGTTRLFTIITNDYFTTYSRRHSLDEFIQIRRTQIQNDLRKKENRVDSLPFGYISSPEIRGMLDEEKGEVDRMRLIQKATDETRARHGDDLGDATFLAGTLMERNLRQLGDSLGNNYLQGTFGFGYMDLPCVSNEITTNSGYGTSYSSKSSSGSFLTFTGSVILALRSYKFISFRLQPIFTYGKNLSFIAGNEETGQHFHYGGNAEIGFGRRFKVIPKFNYMQREGKIYSETDLGTISSKQNMSYDYSTIRYGIGMYYEIDGPEISAELTAWKENVSFQKSIPQQVYCLEATLRFGLAALTAQYSPNYPIAGVVDYPNGYEKKKKAFQSFSFFVPVNLLKFK